MEALTVAVLPARARPLLDGRLPEWLAAWWWDTPEKLVELAPEAEIGWFDLHEKPAVLMAVERARSLRWLSTVYAGVDWLPLADFAARGVTLSNGSGLTSVQVAEWAVMSMLTVAKDYRAVVQAQDRRVLRRRDVPVRLVRARRRYAEVPRQQFGERVEEVAAAHSRNRTIAG